MPMTICLFTYDTTTPAVPLLEPRRAARARTEPHPPFAFHATGLTGFGINRTGRQLAARLSADGPSSPAWRTGGDRRSRRRAGRRD